MSILYYYIDEQTRELKPEVESKVVAQKDHDTDVIRVGVPETLDAVDLETSAVRCMYQRPKETEVRSKTAAYYETSGGYLWYDWTLQEGDTAKTGKINFSVCLQHIEGGLLTADWNSTIGEIHVKTSYHSDDSDEADETITPTVAQRVAVLESVIQGMAGGAPVVVGDADDMTDEAQIYVLSTDGKWYYYDGEEWTAGGEYGAVATDTTLAQSGMPADAKTVGDVLREIAIATLSCFENVAWTNESGQEYYDALLSAIAGGDDFYKVTTNLTHVKISNNSPFVPNGGSYTATFTADAGFAISSITVTHGGASVTVSDNSISIPSVSGDIVITALAAQTSSLVMLHNWDLTKGLVDSITKQIAVLGGASRKSNGLTISNANQYADFPDVWGTDRTIEIDVSSYVRGGTGHSRLFTYRYFSGNTLGRGNGFIYRSTGKWSFYKGSWSDFESSDATYISGKMIKFSITANGDTSIYVNGTLLGTVSGVSFNRGDYTMGFGSESSSGYTCTITGIRVYEGVES